MLRARFVVLVWKPRNYDRPQPSFRQLGARFQERSDRVCVYVSELRPQKKSMPTKKTTVNSALIRVEEIEQRIYFIRGQRVMLDKDLAELYQVETFNLNKAVKRNINRFPDDFMFTLSQEEAIGLQFQIGMSKRKGSGGRRYLPNVFTQEGVAMLSSILRSERAVQVNVLIMRAFVRLRE